MGGAMRKLSIALSALVAVGAARPARANDSEAVLAGGVLTFKKSDGITMESEELTIKPHAVEVAYLFRNTTAADITTRVPFRWPPTSAGRTSSRARRSKWREFANFTVLVDGKPVKFETTAKVDENSRDGSRTATVTHHWQQTFPAGKTVSVKHTFTPAGGFIFSFRHGGKGLETQLGRDYCVGPVLIKAMKKKDEQGSVDQVHYILKTGANWKGPIGRFVLRLVKDRPDQKVSLCMDGFKKVDALTYLLEKTNFTPTQDLKVAFIGY